MTSPFCLAFVGSTQARPAMLITTLLAVLTIMASVTSLEAQYTPVTTVQRALTTGAWMTQPRLKRCKNRPIDQFQIPNNNLGNVNYTIGFRSSSGGATTNLAVPGDLLINDFDVASWTTTNQVARTLEVRPSILAELCSELPYLLYRSWPSTTTLSRNTNDLFKVAADGCELLVAAFGSADHAHMASTISQAPSNSLRVIASSIVQVLATNGGGGNLGDNPFQDRRLISSVPVVSQARSKISRSARTIQARSSARWGVLTAVQPFTHFADAVAADYTTRSVVAAAGVLKSFLVATDRELRSNRARRASESYPWTVQDHKLTASVTVHEQAQWSLLRGFNQSSTHTSMDLLLTNTPIRSALLYLDMGSYSTEYLSGLASSCVLENAVFNTSFTTPKKPATPWFSTRLTAINTPLPLKNSPNSDTYVVSWHMPIIPDAPEVVTIRNAINVPRGNIQFNMQLTATVRTGTAACPNLPIVPLTVQPAYACADEYGFAPRVDALAPQYEKLASAAAPFEAEFMDYALADESFADAEFSDDADGEFALGDEFALEDDAAYSVDDAWDEAGDEAEAGFAFEDDLVDEDGVDEADFAIEDYLFGDEY